jgi:DNA polymerase III delta subunit
MGLFPDPAALLAANPRAILAVGRFDLLALFADAVAVALRKRHTQPLETVSVDISGKGPKNLRGALPQSLFPVPRLLKVTGAGSLKSKEKPKGETKEKAKEETKGKEGADDMTMVSETIRTLAPNDFLLLLAEPPEGAPSWKYEHPLAKAKIKDLGIVPLKAPDDRALLSWLGERCREARLEAEPRLLRHLVESSNGDLLILTGEVEKLSLAFAGGKADLATAGSLTTVVPADDVFALLNALVAGRRDRVLSLLGDLSTAGEAPIYLVAVVASQVRKLLMARHALDAGTPPGEVARAFNPKYPHFAKPLVDAAGQIPYATLVEAFSRLVTADRAMKSSPHPPETILETTLFSLFTPPPMGYSYLATLEEGESR